MQILRAQTRIFKTLKRSQSGKFTKTVNTVKYAGEPVKNFVEMSKTIRNLRIITAIFTDIGAQILKIREKLRADFARLKERDWAKALKEQGK